MPGKTITFQPLSSASKSQLVGCQPASPSLFHRRGRRHSRFVANSLAPLFCRHRLHSPRCRQRRWPTPPASEKVPLEFLEKNGSRLSGTFFVIACNGLTAPRRSRSSRPTRTSRRSSSDSTPSSRSAPASFTPSCHHVFMSLRPFASTLRLLMFPIAPS